MTRSQNVVLTLPYDWRAIGQFLAPALERVDPAVKGTQLLVLTADAEMTVAVAQAAARLADGDASPVVPATSARRAGRLLRARPAAVLVGTPAEVLALVRDSSLKLDTLRALVVAWADDMLVTASEEDIEGVMSEVPKEATRTLVVAAVTAEVEAFVERYMRRARHVGEMTPGEEQAPVALQYVSVAPVARAAALRRLLDELDPPSAVIVARAPESQREVRETLRTLGYAGDDAAVRFSEGPVDEHTALVVLYDVPATRAELDETVRGTPVQVVALAQPRQLAQLRALAGGRVAAYTLPEPGARARQREERVRGELRAVLAAGVPTREVIALEPLLDEFDAVEIAAAALRLADRERERARSVQAGTHTGLMPKASAGAAAAAAAQWKRIFMTVGEMDGANAGDIVGALTNEAGITRQQVGKVELRDNHTLVEVSAADAERVAEKINGAMIRGRRVVARLDQERAAREREGGAGARPRKFDREGGERGERRPPRAGGFDRGDRGDRGPRAGGGDRGPRSGGFDRGARPPRPGGSDRGDRAPRAGGFDRGPRSGPPGPRSRAPERDDRPGRRPGASERQEWAERGERIRHARPRRPDAE